MRIAWRWLFAGMFVMLGAMWFAARAAIALGGDGDDSVLVTSALALGAFVGGATISRHAVVRFWREPVIAAASGFGLLWLGDYLDEELNVLLVLAIMLAATTGGAWIARRFSARAPSIGSLLVLGGLVTIGVVMAVAGLVGMNGNDSQEWVGIVIVLALPAVGGFITQAIVDVRRPWACGGGALLLLLLFAQEQPRSDLGPLFLGVGMVTLIDVAGAAIAARVFRARWAARVEIPEAQAR
jgi:hypothetical protein